MAAIGHFPDYIERVQRILLIALLALVVHLNIPAQPGLKLIGTIHKHRMGQIGMGIQITCIDIA